MASAVTLVPGPRLGSGYLAVVGSHRMFRAALWPRGGGLWLACSAVGTQDLECTETPPPPPPPRRCRADRCWLPCSPGVRSGCTSAMQSLPDKLKQAGAPCRPPPSWTPEPFQGHWAGSSPCLPHTNSWSPAEFTARWPANGGTPGGEGLSVLLEPLRVEQSRSSRPARQGLRRSTLTHQSSPTPAVVSHTLGPGSQHAASQRQKSQVLVRERGWSAAEGVLWAVGTRGSWGPRAARPAPSTSTSPQPFLSQRCARASRGGAGPGTRARGGVRWGRGQGPVELEVAGQGVPRGRARCGWGVRHRGERFRGRGDLKLASPGAGHSVSGQGDQVCVTRGGAGAGGREPAGFESAAAAAAVPTRGAGTVSQHRQPAPVGCGPSFSGAADGAVCQVSPLDASAIPSPQAANSAP